MMTPPKSAALVVAAILTVASAAPGVMIDDFSDGPQDLTAFDLSPGVTALQTDLIGVLGGTRKVYVGAVGDGDLVHGTQVRIDPASSSLRLQSDPAARGYLDLEYGSENPLEIDLTADGSDRFVLHVADVSPELFPGLGDVIVVSGDEGATRSKSVSFFAALAALDGHGQVVIPFAAFDGIDFTHVRSIYIDLGRFREGRHLVLDAFYTTAILPGDANNDGVVDHLDLLAVETHFGHTGEAHGLLPGDANDDGRVDAMDYLFVERHFGATLAMPPNVPEPGPGGVALLANVAALRRRPGPFASRL